MGCLECRRPGFNPWFWKVPWRRKWRPTLLILPGKSHGQRSLAGYSPWGREESDTTEHARTSTHTHTYTHAHARARLTKFGPRMWTGFRSGLFCLIFLGTRASLVAQVVKYPPAMQETRVRSLGREDPLEKGMATHCSILSWRIPWTEESDGL